MVVLTLLKEARWHGASSRSIGQGKSPSQGYCVMLLRHDTSIAVPLYTQVYTAVSTKVVHNSTKAHATMLIGIMGSESLALLG